MLASGYLWHGVGSVVVGPVVLVPRSKPMNCPIDVELGTCGSGDGEVLSVIFLS